MPTVIRIYIAEAEKLLGRCLAVRVARAAVDNGPCTLHGRCAANLLLRRVQAASGRGCVQRLRNGAHNPDRCPSENDVASSAP